MPQAIALVHCHVLSSFRVSEYLDVRVVRRLAGVPSPYAALTILAEDEFAADLVFSDVIMPGMNGVELAGIIRERFPGLPVVLTSGYSNVLAENAHRGFELIQKPYSVELLSRSLRKAISEARR